MELIYFKHIWGGDLIEMGELFGKGSIFNLAKMIVSILQNYKELECKVEKIHIIAIMTLPSL